MSEGGAREGEEATAFTGILADLVGSVPGALGAVFTAGDGESVDYFSDMDPYELKVVGAHASLMLQLLRDSKLNPLSLIVLSGRRLTLWIMPVAESYALTLVLGRRTWSAGLEQAVERAVALLRDEAALS